MTNDIIQTICDVRCYEKDGVVYLHIEDVARGLGFTTTTEKGGVEYTNVRWNRVEECLHDLNFLPQVAENENPHNYYIPENIFYRLCMKAKNAVAESFQAKVADEIIPSIRRHGMYATDDFIQRSISDPDWAISVLQKLKFEREQKELALRQRDEAIRTKYHFVEGRDAEMCGRVGGLTKANTDLRQKNTQLTNANTELVTENNTLKDELGRGQNWLTINEIKHAWKEMYGHYPDWRMLMDFSKKVEIKPIKDVLETIHDPKGGRREVRVNRYHVSAWKLYKEFEDLALQVMQKPKTLFD